jgi:hypothetical protein
MAGDTARAESLAQDLGKRFPLGTQMQSLWLPPVKALLALDRRDPTSALNVLQAPSPIELGNIPFAMSFLRIKRFAALRRHLSARMDDSCG